MPNLSPHILLIVLIFCAMFVGGAIGWYVRSVWERACFRAIVRDEILAEESNFI